MILLAAASLAVQQAAPAANWRELGTHDDGMAFAYDRASLRLDPARSVALVAFRSVRPGGSHAVSEVEIRCATNEARVMTTRNYAANGTPGMVDTVPVELQAIPPGSYFELVRTEVCPAPAGPEA